MHVLIEEVLAVLLVALDEHIVQLLHLVTHRGLSLGMGQEVVDHFQNVVVFEGLLNVG